MLFRLQLCNHHTFWSEIKEASAHAKPLKFSDFIRKLTLLGGIKYVYCVTFHNLNEYTYTEDEIFLIAHTLVEGVYYIICERASLLVG
jgi:hypothetical protein